jgi:uncharacterized protein with FMN-binding domain
MPWRTPREKLQVVAVSAATIGALYGAGYLIVSSPAVATDSPSSVQQDLVPPVPMGGYHDGKYVGTAENSFGGVSVAVTITSGRISGVEITDSTTFYPQRYIDGLPLEVVGAQSADVPVVSGATASWQDFVQAVQRALVQAARGPAAVPSR